MVVSEVASKALGRLRKYRLRLALVVLMTTCMINRLMMGVASSQTCQQHGDKLMTEEMMDEMKKQVQDSCYWSPTPGTRALPTAITERSSRSALRALLQQPPPLSLVPDTCLESDILLNEAMQPSWPPHPDRANFKTPNSLSLSDTKPLLQGQQQYDTLQSSEYQVGRQGFDLRPPTSNHYHANYSNLSGLQHTQPIQDTLPFKKEQEHSEFELLHQRRGQTERITRPDHFSVGSPRTGSRRAQTERITRPDFSVGSPRTGSSLPKEFENLQMLAFSQKQMREQMKNRLERRRSFDKKKQTSPPKREGAGGSKLKFGITADGIQNGPDNYPMLHSPQAQQQQQQLLFSRGFLPRVNQLHDQDMNTTNRCSPGSSSMETKIHVEDTEAMVIKRFEEKVLQLDVGTRLGFKDSLDRLARSARERQHEIRTSTCTSAEPDFAAMMDMDLDSCDRPPLGLQPRVQIETQTNPVDRTLVNMLFFPLRLPGLQRPTDHPSWSRSRAAAGGSSQGNWDWSTPATSEHNIRNGSGNMLQTQFHGCAGSGAPLEAPTSRPVTPHMTWTDSPPLADYASPPAGSSPVNPSILHHRQAGVNLTYSRGPIVHTARQLGGNHSSTTQPVDIRAPRRCDSQSSIASDLSNSPSHGGQVLNFNNVAFHGPSSYSSQDAGSFASDGQHIELAASNHGVDQHHTNQSFAMMNMNDDILGAALSRQNRAEVDQIDRFHPLPSSARYNSNAKNVTVGFSPILYEDGSHFDGESRGRNLGNKITSTGMSPGMSACDHRSATILINMVDTVAYTRSSHFFPA